MIYHQSVFERWPLEDKSVQAVITSPPYYALRRYDIPNITVGDWTGQYGLEETYQLYIEHTLLWCKEAWRVLKDDGVFFLNLADTYMSHSTTEKWVENLPNRETNSWKNGGRDNAYAAATVKKKGATDKCLLDIPARVSIALVDTQGWTKRNNLIWYKPNGMPESVADRFSKKHENIFMFTKQAKYYFDLDSIRERHIGVTDEMYRKAKDNPQHGIGDSRHTGIGSGGKGDIHKQGLRSGANLSSKYKYVPGNLKGKNPGDVWEIPTQASSEKHFAMWPQNLVKRMVLCSTKAGDIVLDPFCGSGTTLKVAEELGRKGIGIDLGYQDVQKRRLRQIQKPLF